MSEFISKKYMIQIVRAKSLIEKAFNNMYEV